MATDKRRGNRETKKPKKSLPKTIAAAPTTKNIGTTMTKALSRG